ncbi:MAG: rod shape-determining protein [Candidatus Terrybacteria bacterium RIFCSPHIGHO2_01_FULL_58_15]|uniref:Cell shape-determining protein MreB n=2 Tax=Candidatus Terryibacteriota TaxID=1817920 RepID=A0A1G2PL27_TERXR|nr:MAG: rod shape-determining protein [Candidatus Terrybacteria bacterium RIFCSPHIGHO2_01_FULL_58_15]
MFVRKIGIDLGTTNSLVFIPGRGVVLNEPTVVAVSTTERRVLAVGQSAKEMIGRTPETIVAHRPMRDGVIADYRVVEAMLRHFLGQTLGSFRILRPDVMVSVPAGITSTERRAVLEAARRAGAREAYVVKEPILAAIGAGLPIHASSGSMIVNVGGGTSEVAIMSLGGIVSWASVRVAGNRIDEAIAEMIKRTHNVAIGERTAENIKIAIGSAMPTDENIAMEVRGRDLAGGLPKIVKVYANDVTEAIADPLRDIIRAVKQVLRDTPPELAADVIENGMVLSGGTALLRNLDRLLEQSTGVPTRVAEEPLLCVARGTGAALESLEFFKRSLALRR